MSILSISIDDEQLALVVIRAIDAHMQGKTDQPSFAKTDESDWILTESMAKALGISVRTIHHYRSKKNTPWIEGRHYKRRTPSSTSQWIWNQALTIKAWKEASK